MLPKLNTTQWLIDQSLLGALFDSFQVYVPTFLAPWARFTPHCTGKSYFYTFTYRSAVGSQGRWTFKYITYMRAHESHGTGTGLVLHSSAVLNANVLGLDEALLLFRESEQMQ